MNYEYKNHTFYVYVSQWQNRSDIHDGFWFTVLIIKEIFLVKIEVAMLRKRSRSVTTKQVLMADHSSLSSPSQNQNRPISPFFCSPRFSNGFHPTKTPSETETISPTSTLDNKPFSAIGNQPFGLPSSFSGTKHSREKLDPKGIGLALVDSLKDENTDSNFNSSQPNSPVVFKSKLKIQIPPFPPSTFSPAETPKSPADFGIKTRNSQFRSANSGTPTKEAFAGCLSASEMELSEDYTRVVSHGPNPRTTHIFGDCILESCCGVVGLSQLKSDYSEKLSSPSESFLSFCHTCKKSLEQGKDIYMYRGEKAFCSRECRCEEMHFDGVDN